ncbi:Rho/RAC guanine nucleotide exchange factor, putative [Entamoeba invadens IP1]|uniref:Rho/RAC guanine nucleotide exchange factor, putative n=1 Tax=Entamoeba invadens IP1 TaxID=370355 RepID=UPI0002C3F602|nr:Rho/RAC guanine nucleotide exchange factor, putative [Entamoeba invadens IP1]ELP90749.1 Rho/RAC guanine nucleotide exchange factor, putative [Entamoeba invadens IP1]|eukprot:XP_004257520.1 Rho/RAC guanine nucleotide exchange factor, putative [Entamoeba invadens IP1]
MESVAATLVQSRIRGYIVRRLHNKNTLFRRYCVIKELSETEVSFTESMRKLYMYFEKPLKELSHKPGCVVIPELLIGSVFPRVEKVFINGCVISNALEDLKVHWKYDNMVTPTLKKCLNLLLPLSEYTLLFESQKKCLQTANKIRGFKEFVIRQSMHKELLNLSFNDLTIMPVQRLMRYPILIKELIKATPQTHPEYNEIIKTQELFERFIVNVNNESKMHDYMLEASSCVCSVENMVQSWRCCLFYGLALVNSPTNYSYVFVFNDRIAYYNDICMFSFGKKKRYYLRHSNSQVIRFIDVKKFGPSADTPRQYEIYIGESVDFITIPPEENYEQWTNTLNTAISQFSKDYKRY